MRAEYIYNDQSGRYDLRDYRSRKAHTVHLAVHRLGQDDDTLSKCSQRHEITALIEVSPLEADRPLEARNDEDEDGL